MGLVVFLLSGAPCLSCQGAAPVLAPCSQVGWGGTGGRSVGPTGCSWASFLGGSLEEDGEGIAWLCRVNAAPCSLHNTGAHRNSTVADPARGQTSCKGRQTPLGAPQAPTLPPRRDNIPFCTRKGQADKASPGEGAGVMPCRSPRTQQISPQLCHQARGAQRWLMKPDISQLECPGLNKPGSPGVSKAVGSSKPQLGTRRMPSGLHPPNPMQVAVARGCTAPLALCHQLPWGSPVKMPISG